MKQNKALARASPMSCISTIPLSISPVCGLSTKSPATELSADNSVEFISRLLLALFPSSYHIPPLTISLLLPYPSSYHIPPLTISLLLPYPSPYHIPPLTISLLSPYSSIFPPPHYASSTQPSILSQKTLEANK